MDVIDFISSVDGFDALSTHDKICAFAWFLHEYKSAQTFGNSDIRECFRAAHLVSPDVSVYLPRLADKKPAELIRVKGAYKLEGTLRRALDEKFSCQRAVAITKLLSGLPDQIPDLAERAFLSEALNCYKVGAFRASIVMTWNLALDHLISWILSDPNRLSSFDQANKQKYPKRGVVNRSDFEDLLEHDIVEFCRVAKLASKNIIDILREKLKRRNAAAHPSGVIITQAQADDVITDLVNNVVLALK
jgi:hypothetical protein